MSQPVTALCVVSFCPPSCPSSFHEQALVSNCETLESNAVVTGRFTGDLCHPLLFCPEMLNEEFASEIADMKNSVGNRSVAWC